jgi:mannose-6-phosphate isomerase-like protein (cupin superfamily)
LVVRLAILLSMKPLIVKQSEIREYFTDERCHIRELLNGEEDTGLSYALARVEPGVTTAWHHLKGTSERYLVLSGGGIMEVGALPPTPVGPGDLVLIPPDTRQRITNDGPGDLVFCCICTPGFDPLVYVDLEKSGNDTAS